MINIYKLQFNQNHLNHYRRLAHRNFRFCTHISTTIHEGHPLILYYLYHTAKLIFFELHECFLTQLSNLILEISQVVFVTFI